MAARAMRAFQQSASDERERQVVGTVAELWRYPAKSMMGGPMISAAFGAAGMLGDRGWAVVDERRGGIRGAKKIADLMKLRAEYVSEPTETAPVPPIRITLPDGSVVHSNDPDVDARLSEAVRHPVTLWPLQPAENLDHYRRGRPDSSDSESEMRDIFGRRKEEPLPDLSRIPSFVYKFESAPGTYFDVFPVHLLTTASLESLAGLLPTGPVDVRRFRPNIVLAVNSESSPFPESQWIDRILRVGAATLKITSHCARCVMVTRDFADLDPDTDLLRTIVRHADQNLGVYAEVTVAGTVTVGDQAELIG